MDPLMQPFIVEVIAITSVFIGMPLVIAGGIIGNKIVKNKRYELELRDREIALEERRLALDEQAYSQALLDNT